MVEFRKRGLRIRRRHFWTLVPDFESTVLNNVGKSFDSELGLGGRWGVRTKCESATRSSGRLAALRSVNRRIYSVAYKDQKEVGDREPILQISSSPYGQSTQRVLPPAGAWRDGSLRRARAASLLGFRHLFITASLERCHRSVAGQRCSVDVHKHCTSCLCTSSCGGRIFFTLDAGRGAEMPSQWPRVAGTATSCVVTGVRSGLGRYGISLSLSLSLSRS